ncbi:LOG family protein [Klebsiella pneumoniae]|uniref:AMP nucleosidase n=1 Tax=Klebsiella pneumoniae TaxID=573 RepID=A0A7X1HU93_KLEPN|nr:LOG family protein [Klebsiella pneumoniae]
MAHMMFYADAFIALPGGFAHSEELFQVISWARSNLHQNPSVC